MEPSTPSSALLVELMSIRGNDKCHDCASADNMWASINMGILLCIDCAGRHRRFGVNVSFVRSLHMDSWSDQQLEMIRQGGNRRLQDYFNHCSKGAKAINGTVDTKALEAFYTSDDAERYRLNLKKRVNRKLDRSRASNVGELEVSAEEMLKDARTASDDSDEAELYPGANQKHLVSMPLLNEEIYNDRATHVYSVTFYDATLGLSLRKGTGENSAFVSMVSAKGQAEAQGVLEKDVILSVNGKAMHKYDDVTKAVQRSLRPITITFLRRGMERSNAKGVSEEELESKRHCPASMVEGVVGCTAGKPPEAMSGVKNKPPELNLRPENRASPTTTTSTRSRNNCRDGESANLKGKKNAGRTVNNDSAPAASPRVPRKAATPLTSGRSPASSSKGTGSGKGTPRKDRTSSTSSSSTTPVVRRRSNSGASPSCAYAGTNRAGSGDKMNKSTPKSGGSESSKNRNKGESSPLVDRRKSTDTSTSTDTCESDPFSLVKRVDLGYISGEKEQKSGGSFGGSKP